MQRIGFVITEGFQLLGLAGQAVFEYANTSVGKQVYEMRLLSEKGGPVRSSLNAALQTERGLHLHGRICARGGGPP
jgi:transcriptional regulator GlxA family with amidase domain